MDLLKIFEETKEDTTDLRTFKVDNAVDEFYEKHEKTFDFSVLNYTQHNKLLKNLFCFVDLQSSTGTKCMKIVRILSRDRNLTMNIDNEECYMKKIVAVLSNDFELLSDGCLLKAECLKCLCNWLYHSPNIRKTFQENLVSPILMKDIADPKNLLQECQFYEIRLLFLISALVPSSRKELLQAGVLSTLMDVMEKSSSKIAEKSTSNLPMQITCEVLKSLFNILLELDQSFASELLDDCTRLVQLSRKMLIGLSPFEESSANDLLTHIAHVFVNIPKEALYVLVEKVLDEEVGDLTQNGQLFELHDMYPMTILLDALIERMKIKNYTIMKEKSMAILTAFCYICRVNPVIRRYLRKEILPPFTPSDVRPEQLDNLKGQLIRMMTTVDVPLKNMAADFLFVLCKENAERLVRYAGYGNSAGFLASRGLMIPAMSNTEGDYSEDELSDFEGDFDSMTGAIPKPREDPFDKMTESEKEAEMEKLMCMMDRLKQLNVIKPMTVTDSGKLRELNSEDDD